MENDMKRTTAIVALSTLMACTPPPPVVTSFNGSSVTVQLQGDIKYLPADARTTLLANADAEAGRICKKGSGKGAERTSFNTLQAGTYSVRTIVLYLCL
jgi:hypothetical protein